MADMKNKAHEKVDTMANQAKDAAQSAAEQAREAGHGLVDKAKDVASTVADRAQDAAQAVGKGADRAADWVGGNIEGLGHTIRENAPSWMSGAADKVASGLESSGKYLQEEGLTGMAKDVGELIRRNPIPAMLVGIGLGFLLARATSSRS